MHPQRICSARATEGKNAVSVTTIAAVRQPIAIRVLIFPGFISHPISRPSGLGAPAAKQITALSRAHLGGEATSQTRAVPAPYSITAHFLQWRPETSIHAVR